MDNFDHFNAYKVNYRYESWQDKPKLIKYPTEPPSDSDVKIDPIMKIKFGQDLNDYIGPNRALDEISSEIPELTGKSDSKNDETDHLT